MSQETQEIQLRNKLLVVLRNIVKKCELDALAVVDAQTADKIAYYSVIDTNSEVFCTLAASVCETGEMVTARMSHGPLDEITVLGSEGYTILVVTKTETREYILIGAGRDFYNLAKTGLILKEQALLIPQDVEKVKRARGMRKACDHFCEDPESLYCCVCGKRENRCEVCQSSMRDHLGNGTNNDLR